MSCTNGEAYRPRQGTEMEARVSQSAGEVRRLQRCINDLVSVLAMPAIWTGGDSTLVGRTLLDVLLGMLALDLVYVRVQDLAGGAPIEMVRQTPERQLPVDAAGIGEMLRHWLGDDTAASPRAVGIPDGDRDLSVVPLRLGLQDDIGVLVAGSSRADFPTEAERLVLNVAANQAAIGLREAHLLEEQKQLTGFLDRRVAERTAQLALANEELQQEVDERRLAEARLRREEGELKRSEARKAAILDSALDCIMTIDHQGRITEFNPAAERTFGYTRAEVLGRSLADVVVPPADRAAHRQGLARYLATGEARVLGRRIEMTAIRADGAEFPVELAITPIPLAGPPSFTGYLRDITERKAAEEELRRTAAFLAEAQRLSSTGSFAWRLATDEIIWSEQLYRIFGFDLSEPVTLARIASRVHPDDLARLYAVVDRAREDGKDFEYEHRLLMPDQSVRYLHLVAHGRRAGDGVKEYIGAVQDVTERRLSDEALGKVRAELAHMARVTTLGALTASIAHEVNQPLSGIITNASTCLRMLAAEPPNLDGARETARRTIRDGNRASEVITRLRGLFAKKEVASEPLDLNEATREVIALSMSELQRNRVILRPELAENLPVVTGDRVQLQQVILNLLLNAADAMSEVEDRPRQLLVRSEPEGEEAVRLTVQDAGTGIDPGNADRLFEAFYSTKQAGMGIGLSVSRSIIESHRGRLWASPNDGPGATFAFTVPRGTVRAT